jgi:hypothetical protein
MSPLQRRITLPDFATVLQTVFPPANYNKVFNWAKTGFLPTYRDPSLKRSHYYIDTRFLSEFLKQLGLIDTDIAAIMLKLRNLP